jgi:hypothetical protein
VPEEAGLDIDFDAELAGIQGTVAGVPPPAPAEVEVAGTIVTSSRTVELHGQKFRIAETVGLMPLLKFSAFAEVEVSDTRALGALYAMLKDCIHPGQPGCGECAACKRDDERACKVYDPGDWHAFEDWAIECKADAEDLMEVVSRTIELISGRPTQQAPPSSAGRRSTRDASMARSSARGRRGSRR